VFPGRLVLLPSVPEERKEKLIAFLGKHVVLVAMNQMCFRGRLVLLPAVFQDLLPLGFLV
jgi:hypothetical protein